MSIEADSWVNETMAVTSMRGSIVGPAESGGWIADMTSPTALPGVEMPSDAFRQTRAYPNSPGSRVRIGRIPLPDTALKPGDRVAAVVATTTLTEHYEDRTPPVTTQEDRALKWGLVPDDYQVKPQ